MILRPSLRRLSLIAAAAVVACSGEGDRPSAGVPAARAPSAAAEAALEADAREIARGSGVSPQEAAARLRMEAASAYLVGALRREFPDRVTGIRREWTPEPRIVVRLKGRTPVPSRVVETSEGPVRIVFESGGAGSEAELSAAMQRHASELGALLPGLQGMGSDAEGVIVLDVYAVGPERQAVLAKEPDVRRVLGYPARIRIVDAPVTEGPAPQASAVIPQ